MIHLKVKFHSRGFIVGLSLFLNMLKQYLLILSDARVWVQMSIAVTLIVPVGELTHVFLPEPYCCFGLTSPGVARGKALLRMSVMALRVASNEVLQEQ